MLRIALRVIYEEALTPQTVTPHSCVANLSTYIHLETTCAVLICSPSLCLANMSIVVIRELITLLNDTSVTVLVVVVEIVLICNRVATHIALSKLINIYPVITAQQVLNLVVVLSTVYASLNTCQEVVVSVEIVRDISSEVVVDLVGVTLLDHIVRTVTVSIRSC